MKIKAREVVTSKEDQTKQFYTLMFASGFWGKNKRKKEGGYTFLRCFGGSEVKAHSKMKKFARR